MRITGKVGNSLERRSAAFDLLIAVALEPATFRIFLPGD
jgi:hypothetical protein